MTIRIGPLAFKDFIVAEEVRPEANKKWSILGAFSGDIVVPSVPVSIRLAIYGEGEADKDIKQIFHYRIRLDGTDIFEVSGEFEGAKGYIALPMPGMSVTIAKAGDLTFELSEDKKNWVQLASKKIIVGAVD